MLLDVLLSLGLLLSTASQLRTFLEVIGPGELLLLLWIVPNLFREADRLGPALTPPLTRLLTFWLVFALALGIGTIVGFAVEQTRDTDGYKHDTVAYLLTALVSCMLVVEPQCKRLRRVAWLLVSLGSIAVFVQIVAAEAEFTLPFIDLWYWDRFRGWSDDANLFAFLCAVLLFIAIHLAETAEFTREKFLAIACCLPPSYAGFLSHSDSFVVALVFGGTAMLALWPANWLARSSRKTAWRFLSIGAVALFLLVLDFATGWISEGFLAVAYSDSDQVWIRLALWREAIKVGLNSYLLGLGPGPHLETPYVQLRGTTVREAHNVILHVFTQGGIIAVADCCLDHGDVHSCDVSAKTRSLDGATLRSRRIFYVSFSHSSSAFLVRHSRDLGRRNTSTIYSRILPTEGVRAGSRSSEEKDCIAFRKRSELNVSPLSVVPATGRRGSGACRDASGSGEGERARPGGGRAWFRGQSLAYRLRPAIGANGCGRCTLRLPHEHAKLTFNSFGGACGREMADFCGFLAAWSVGIPRCAALACEHAAATSTTSSSSVCTASSAGIPSAAPSPGTHGTGT